MVLILDMKAVTEILLHLTEILFTVVATVILFEGSNIYAVGLLAYVFQVVNAKYFFTHLPGQSLKKIWAGHF